MKLCKQPRFAFLAIVIAIVSATSSHTPDATARATADARPAPALVLEPEQARQHTARTPL